MSKKDTLLAFEPRVDMQEKKPASNRSFGFVFAGVFALIGLWPLLHGHAPRFWSLAAAALFLAAGLYAPRILAPLNAVWTLIGAILHKIVTPLVMAVLFFIVVTPTALILRALGKDILRLRPAPQRNTYWIARSPPGPDAATMTNQF